MKIKIKGFFVFLLVSILTMAVPAAGLGPVGENDEAVVAVVDGEEIYRNELDEEAGLMMILMQIQQMSPRFGQFLMGSPEGEEFLEAYERNVLDDIIDQKLMEMEAERQGIELTREEEEEFATEQIEMIKQQEGMSEEEILEALAQQGIGSLDEFKEIIIAEGKENLLVRKMLADIDPEEMDVSEEKIEEAYERRGYAEANIPMEEVEEEILYVLTIQRYTEKLKEQADIKIHY